MSDRRKSLDPSAARATPPAKPRVPSWGLLIVALGLYAACLSFLLWQALTS